MKRAILVIVFSCATSFSAIDPEGYRRGDWDSLRAEALALGARGETLNRKLQELDRLKSLRALCEQQLKASAIPVSCFGLLDAEKDAGILSASRWKSEVERIDTLCVRALSRIHDVSSDQLRLRPPPRTSCSREMSAHLEKLRYGSAFRDPLAVFADRHRF